MIVVKCPKCEKNYEPGLDETSLANRPPNTSMKVLCPACGQWLRLPEGESVEGPNVPPEILKEMMKQSRPVPGEVPAGAMFIAGVNMSSKPWWKFW